MIMTFHLKFDVKDDWSKNVENILKVADKIKEKHPEEPIIVEVQFCKSQEYNAQILLNQPHHTAIIDEPTIEEKMKKIIENAFKDLF